MSLMGEALHGCRVGTDSAGATNEGSLCRVRIGSFSAKGRGSCCWPGPAASHYLPTSSARGLCWTLRTATPTLRSPAAAGVAVDTVRTWRGRYADEGMAGLADRPRAGRPPPFTAVQVAEVKALACQMPAETGVPLSRWSCPDLAGEIIRAGIAASMSASTVRRILAADTIKPWQYRSWLFIRDPQFAAKATRVLDLYARIWDGIPLSDGEYVISSDEKTSIQARCRCHPTLPPGKSRMMRINHEYDRGGALAYLAAYDVHRAHVTGLCADTTGIDPFMELVEEVMTQEPYASAKRVFWIVDNGSSHRGQTAIDRLAARYPNAVMVHTPVHASWLNQVEIYFSIVQRKVVTPNDFTNLDQVHTGLPTSNAATTTPPHNRSTGASTATTSTDSSPESPHNP